MKTETHTDTPPTADCSSATCSASLALQIAELQSTLRPLLNRMSDLKSAERKALSREFIAANQITRADVEMSSGEGKEWFRTAWEFGIWISANSSKKWAEWNGRIYHSADLANGRMPDMPGEVDSLPNAMMRNGQEPSSDSPNKTDAHGS